MPADFADQRRLEDELQKALAQLQDRTRELERIAEAVEGRELKMIFLEQEVARLREQLARFGHTNPHHS